MLTSVSAVSGRWARITVREIPMAAILALGALVTASIPLAAAHATTFEVLYNFNGPNGANPSGVLTSDGAGGFLGTTQAGGKYGWGEVFDLVPNGNTWKLNILYNFDGGNAPSTDGWAPLAGVTRNQVTGKIYGTTGAGAGLGTIFELTPPSPGKTTWAKNLIHVFRGSPSDGDGPNFGSLIIGPNGELYGATSGGGAKNQGTVFRLDPPTANVDHWSITILHSFTGGNDGGSLYAGLVMDPSGALYGTTLRRETKEGTFGDGTLFKLTPPTAGKTIWASNTLLDFNSTMSSMVAFSIDSTGNLFGVYLGSFSPPSSATPAGNLYELSPPTQGKTAWTYHTLGGFPAASSNSNDYDIDSNYTPLAVDASGNFYGGGHGKDHRDYRWVCERQWHHFRIRRTRRGTDDLDL